MPMREKEDLLHDELIIVRNSGEIPEIAFHGSLHYLTRDPEGPGLTLTAADICLLEAQVEARYREIILRDLDPANRDLRIYRGIKRARWNWERLGKFRYRQSLPEDEGLKREAGSALLAFLDQETREVLAGQRASSVNCTAAELRDFCRQLGMETGQLPPGWERLCL